MAKVNAMLESTWRRGWLALPRLDPDLLVAKACQQTGFSDFGPDGDWRDRLDCLAGALDREAKLNALGLTAAYGQLVAALSGRLRAQALLQRHPEIIDIPLRAPIIIVGQMRSGSTRMQRLLACDPRFSYTRFFESWNPIRRWPGLPFDDRIIRAWLALRVAKALNPRFSVIHPSHVAQADEEFGLHNLSIYGTVFEAQWRVPSFARRGECMDEVAVYFEFRRYLQTLRWLRNRNDERPWILKMPQFTQDLNAVLAAFPDARLIVLHRDPVELVGSSASLVHNQMVMQSDEVDLHWIGREWVHKIALRTARVAKARAGSLAPAIDVHFEAMNADWRGEIAKVYAMLGVPFPSTVQESMARYMGRRSHGRLREHKYSIADFGLSEATIRQAMAA